MKKKENIFARIFLLLFFLCPTTWTMAQSASTQINEVKRNNAYLFEEATAATAKEARDFAIVKLAKVLGEYMEEKYPGSAAKFEDLKDLAEGAEEIVADRGSQKRVFLYFSKNDIDATAEEALQTDSPEQEDNMEPETIVEPQPSDEDTTSTPEYIPEPVIEQQETTSIVTENPVSESCSSNSVSDDSLAEWQKRLIGSFLREGLTILSAKDLVNTYNIEHKIKRFGSMSNPPLQGVQAFYVFADETGKIIAVLGRDEGGQRLNYVSGNFEHLSDYNSQNYIWFTLNK
ncbi:MAG: hypothetical protein IJ832_02260 [Bacteroidaceae bacterium]|nr:hypothetical protein [Bacteroidaceae bacterium]